MSQPTVVTNISHISDDLRNLIGDDFIGDSSSAALSVSVAKLEMPAAKVSLSSFWCINKRLVVNIG